MEGNFDLRMCVLALVILGGAVSIWFFIITTNKLWHYTENKEVKKKLLTSLSKMSDEIENYDITLYAGHSPTIVLQLAKKIDGKLFKKKVEIVGGFDFNAKQWIEKILSDIKEDQKLWSVHQRIEELKKEQS